MLANSRAPCSNAGDKEAEEADLHAAAAFGSVIPAMMTTGVRVATPWLQHHGAARTHGVAACVQHCTALTYTHIRMRTCTRMVHPVAVQTNPYATLCNATVQLMLQGLPQHIQQAQARAEAAGQCEGGAGADAGGAAAPRDSNA